MISSSMQHRLKAIGGNLKLARKRRRKSLKQAAEMLGTSISSLRRMEAGDPSVKIGTFLAAIEAYQLEDSLRIAEPEDDTIGLTLENQRLPERIRQKKDRRLDF